jgi:hypothetical protein
MVKRIQERKMYYKDLQNTIDDMFNGDFPVLMDLILFFNSDIVAADIALFLTS